MYDIFRISMGRSKSGQTYKRNRVERNIYKLTYYNGTVKYRVEKEFKDPEGKAVYENGTYRRYSKHFDTLEAARTHLQEILANYEEEKRRDKPSYIYFILNKDTNHVKIGTAVDVVKRFRVVKLEIRRALKLYDLEEPNLELLGFMPVTRTYTENYVQSLFNEHRYSGEWFHWCSDIEQFMQENKVI
jgi:hypothetical protein